MTIPTSSRSRRAQAASLTVLGVALALALGVLGGSRLATDTSTASGSSAPSTDSVDAGFARDMQAHHAQAVRMSVLVREATDDPEIETLALDIMLTQQQQIGQMFAWLRSWGLPQSATTRMAWMQDSESMGDMPGMDHGSGGMSMAADEMPGMATPEQLERLERLEGDPAEQLYLRLMVPHHQAGVEMAQFATDYAQEEEVRSLAEGIVTAQSAEIQVLQDLLDARS